MTPTISSALEFVLLATWEENSVDCGDLGQISFDSFSVDCSTFWNEYVKEIYKI